MIRGLVQGLQPRIDVTFRLTRQPDLKIECVVDTGFAGELTLPPAAITALGLPYLSDLDANLADGSNARVDVHLARIVWDGLERDVAVLAMGRRPLVGTGLLDGLHLGVDFVDGGAVSITELRPPAGASGAPAR